jgi:transcriptional regulator with XRE-family HTH domain
MNSRKVVGNNLRDLRNERGLTQEKLSALSGVDQGYIGTLERGRVNVSVDTLDKISKALKIKTVEFFRVTK